MFNSPVLEILIGLGTLFLVFSVVASAIAEAFSAKGNWRGKLLKYAISHLLHESKNYDEGVLKPGVYGGDLLTEKFFKHSSIKVLHNEGRLPSWIPPETFSNIVIEEVARQSLKANFQSGASPAVLVKAFGDAVGNFGAEAVSEDGLVKASREAHQELLDELSRIYQKAQERPIDRNSDWAQQRLANLRAEISSWYDNTMDRLKGWYKRRLQKWLLVIGAVMALFVNVDVIQITKSLYGNAALRDSISQNAEGVIDILREEVNATNQSESEIVKAEKAGEVLDQIGDLNLPIGWREASFPWGVGDWDIFWWILAKILGLGIAAYGISMGAPFWFDILNKLVNLRAAGGQTAVGAQGHGGLAGSSTESDGEATVKPISTEQLAKSLPDDYWDKSIKNTRDLTPDSVSRNKTGALMGRLSEVAYRTPDVAEKILATHVKGFKFIENKQTETQLFHYKIPETKTLVISFRGTEPNKVKDILTDAKFRLAEESFALKGESEQKKLEIHRGFYGSLQSIWSKGTSDQDLDGYLEDAVKSSDTEEVWITGHSLGGALATLASIKVREYIPADKVHLFTYGCPRVGNDSIVSLFKDSDGGTGINAYRYVNNEDLVTRVPPRVVGYKHVGQVLYFKANGELQEGVQGWWRFLKTVVNASEDFKDGLGQTAQDHSMVRYIQRLDSYENLS